MIDIKRYECETVPCPINGYRGEMQEHAAGGYVLYSDYLSLKKKAESMAEIVQMEADGIAAAMDIKTPTTPLLRHIHYGLISAVSKLK